MTARTGSRVKDVVRSFNKRVLNPVMLLMAGRRHWYAGVIRHTGRRSGKSYDTPVLVLPAAGVGFVIPLPYGTGVDWLRNVLAAGKASVKVKGETWEVTEPVIIDAAAAAKWLTPHHRRRFARFGIGNFLLVHRAAGGARQETHPSQEDVPHG